MFLCEKCHKEGGCESNHMGFRSQGACEGCGQVTDCYDCHAYNFNKPSEVDALDNKTLISEAKVDMETLRLAKSHTLVQRRAQEAIVDAVIIGLEPEDRKVFEAYENQENPCYVEPK